MNINRRGFLKAAGIGAVSVLAGCAINSIAQEKQRGRFNVLMLPVDDLRPALGCYGVKKVVSPNIDKLASKGMVFRRAYTMVSICSPARTCFLTGCRPDTTKIFDLETHFRKTIPDVVTLPQCFRKNGYESIGMGKVYHNKLNDMASWDRWIDVNSDKSRLDELTQKIREKLEKEAKDKGLKGGDLNLYSRGMITGCLDVADEAYGDGEMTDTAVKELEGLAKSGKRFFMAVGYRKPHLPFIAPKKYWDLYKEEEIDLASNPFHPKGMPKGAVDEFPGELGQYWDAKELAEKQKAAGKEYWPAEFSRKLIHGYYACVSYVDAQVGRLMATLEKSGLDKNTVVVLWGDHGWHLGENGTWGKHTNMEWGTRSPLILHVPGQKNAGVGTDRLAEFVDVYPTLVDACGLAVPAGCQGVSLMPLVDEPKRKWKEAAFSQYIRKVNGFSCRGYSMRTEQWRYTEWRKKNDISIVVARELYDHRSSDDENENLAGKAEYADIVKDLCEKLKAGWQVAKPR